MYTAAASPFCPIVAHMTTASATSASTTATPCVGCSGGRNGAPIRRHRIAMKMER